MAVPSNPRLHGAVPAHSDSSGPLASQNRHGCWALLCHLRRFGPTRHCRQLRFPAGAMSSIRDHLKYADDGGPVWRSARHATEHPLPFGIFNRLVDAGWFRGRYGIERPSTWRKPWASC